MNTKTIKIISVFLQVIISLLYLQTLFFKFSAHPDSVFIFSKLGMEPYGRIGLGVFELITAILILVPKTKIIAGILSCGIISGAIFSHLAILGIEVQNDGGGLFFLSMIVFICSILFLLLNYSELITLKNSILNKKKN